MTNLDLFKTLGHRLAPEPAEEYDLIDILVLSLEPATLLLVEKDIGKALEPIIEIVKAEVRADIRADADKLPADDPLRLAIEGVTPGP